MDVSAYISAKLTFDLTGATPKLRVQDDSAYPAGVAETLKGWIEITQPDRISSDQGSINAPAIQWDGSGLPAYEFNLRKASDGGHQKGTYTVTYNVLHEGVLTTWSKTFVFQYAPVTVSLERQFNVFTPSLKYEDVTSYAVSLYSIVAQSTGWTAQIGTVGSTSGSGSVFDLVYNLKYWDAAYTITFSKEITYRHTTYTYLYVEESFSQTVETSADTPPAPSVLLGYLDEIKQRFVSRRGTCEPYAQYVKAYIRATALLYHLSRRICAGSTDGVVDYVAEFLEIYYDYDGVDYQNTNAEIPTYDTGDCGSGSSDVPAHILAITQEMINQWNAAYAAIPPRDVELVVGVDGPAAGSSSYVSAALQGWNVRLYLNRLRQTMRSDWISGELYYSKPYASDTLTLSGGVWATGDLIQLEFYRSIEDIVGG